MDQQRNAKTDEPLTEKNGARRRRQGRFINPHLVLLKVSLFLIFGATSSLVPYLTIHMQSIGLTVAEIATIYLTLLFTTCLSPPITGCLVDRTGQYKPVVMVILVLNLAAHHSLDLVPRRQLWELKAIKPQLSWNVASNGSLVLNEACPNNECPALGAIEKKLSSSCLMEPLNVTTNIEVLLSISNLTSSSCGFVTLPACTINETMIISNPMYIQCARSSEYDQTFWYYLLVRFISTTMLTATLTITDPITLTMIDQYGGDFGREKLFSSAGMAIFTPLTGLMIDYFSEGYDDTNYKPAFYTYDALLGLSLITVFFLPIGKKLPSESILKHLFCILKLPHVLTFIFFLFCMGNFWGFIESYKFVIMKEMGSPNYLLGLTYTVGTVFSIPMMYLTNPITRFAGHVNLLVLAFFAHEARILGYSFMYNPFWCFPVELNEAISCYFMWVVATTYCAILAPNSLVATLIGVSGMVHFCLGKGIGSFFGGFLIAQHGTRMGFRYMGYIAIGCGICYKLLHLVWLKKYDQHRAIELDEQAAGELRKRRVSLVTKFDQFGSLTSITQPMV